MVSCGPRVDGVVQRSRPRHVVAALGVEHSRRVAVNGVAVPDASITSALSLVVSRRVASGPMKQPAMPVVTNIEQPVPIVNRVWPGPGV